MKLYRYLLLNLFLALTLSGCDQGNGPASDIPVESDTPIDATRFIRSADLNRRMQGDTLNYVFDVRAEASYAESHIDGALSMPYGKIGPDDVSAPSGITPDTPIVTYCGCPHALAGVAADQLIEWGYRNVRVLHEGYWYWRDNRYPVVGAQAQSITVLRLAGVVESRPTGQTEDKLFFRNPRNGQLEVAVIDAHDRFDTEFHVLGLRRDDRFEIRLGGLDAPVIGRFTSPDGRETDREITLKILGISAKGRDSCGTGTFSCSDKSG